MALRSFSRNVLSSQAISRVMRDLNLLRPVSSSATYQQKSWKQAVSNAEKVVGYPTSFLSLRCLMSDEISNIAVYLKKLIGTGHPLLSTAKKLVYSQDKSHETRGLIVLLVSKAANSKKSSDILQVQRSLAEITELIHTAHLIHRGVINLQVPNNNLEMGNKMAILCGDFLLAHACVTLAALENTKVVELISQAIADISTAEFLDLASQGDDPVEKWREQTNLRHGSLLANACQCTLMLGGNVDLIQDAHSFGREIALAWEANIELQSYIKGKGKGQQTLSLLFPSQSFETVVTKFQDVRNFHVDEAVHSLKRFPHNEATSALHSIVNALKC